MARTDHLRALGEEIERQRVAAGYRSVKALAERVGISHQRLSEIINGYRNPSRGVTIPSDETLESLAGALGAPVSRYHALLGRFPDAPYPAFDDPDAVAVAEAYARLSPSGKKILLGMARLLLDVEGAEDAQAAGAVPGEE